MSDAQCPNCGHELVPYRTERQQAGDREVQLEWVICPGCQHVALQSWTFTEHGTTTEARPRRGQQDTEQHPEQSRERRPSNRIVLRSFARGR